MVLLAQRHIIFNKEEQPMKKKNGASLLAAGVLAGMVIGTPTAHAAVEYLKALPTSSAIYVDGEEVRLEAYTIGGSNYVKLRDIGRLAGFNVYWDGAVQVDTDAPYTGEAPTTQAGTITLPTDGSRYIPQAGDIIPCDDGTEYAITDVSRYDNNLFASGPVGELPDAVCDWSSFPEVALPRADARRYRLDSGDYLFVRNVYECRRMQYTIMNLAGNHPDTSIDGKLRYGSKGTPYVRIEFGIPDDVTAQKFWPWREEDIARVFNSCPPGTYSIDCWDVYKNGIFLRTEYNISAF